MARSFANSTTDYMAQGTAAFPTTGSLALWVKPTWAQTDGASHNFFCVRDSGATYQFVVFKNGGDNKLYCGWQDISGANDTRVNPASTSLLTQNAWNHIVLTWTAGGTTTLYINGTSAGTHGSTFTTNTAGVQQTIGTLANGSIPLAGFSAGAAIAEVAVWSVVLAGSEVTTLYNSGSNGALASEVQNASLVSYLPIWGVHDPEPDMVSGSPSGTIVGTTKAAHAPMDLYLVQSTVVTTASSNTNVTANVATLPAVGNTLLVRVWGLSSSDASGISCADNQSGNSYLPSKFQQDGTAEWCAEFSGVVVGSSAPFNVTVSGAPAASNLAIFVTEVYPHIYVDQTASATGSSTSPAPGSVTTTKAPEYGSTVFTTGGTGATATAPSTYGRDGADVGNVVTGAGASRTFGVTGAINPTWTCDNHAWACLQVTYTLTAPAVGGGRPWNRPGPDVVGQIHFLDGLC